MGKIAKSKYFLGEQDKEDVIQTNQKMLNDHQNLVLKFQELDISQEAMIEKNANQLKATKENYESQVNFDTHSSLIDKLSEIKI